jgi:hypothetical protein
MSDSEETIYSTMFKSLKHPVRRKILRVLSDKPTSFSDLLNELGVSSSHLTYHLESLGELVAKLDGGSYKLSTFGEAAVNTMRIVEDAPVVQTTQKWSMSFRWKPIFGVLTIAIVLLAGFSVVQFNSLNQMAISLNQLQDRYNQLSSLTGNSTDKAISFLRDVIELDLTKYDLEQLSNTATEPDGVMQQSLVYSLKGVDSSMTVAMVFKNKMLSSYSVSLLDGTPAYDKAQPFVVLDSAKWLLQKMCSYESSSYLEDMNQTLYQLTSEGNLKFNMSVAGAITNMQWYYTENGVDFARKGLKLTFDGIILKELDDSYFLYSIGNTKVNIDQAEAIQAAKSAVKNYPLPSGTQQVTSYTIQDATAVFDPAPREDPLTLVPCWQVTLYLDNLPASININRISVTVWADTGKTEPARALSG